MEKPLRVVIAGTFERNAFYCSMPILPVKVSTSIPTQRAISMPRFQQQLTATISSVKPVKMTPALITAARRRSSRAFAVGRYLCLT